MTYRLTVTPAERVQATDWARRQIAEGRPVTPADVHAHVLHARHLQWVSDEWDSELWDDRRQPDFEL